MQIGTVRQYSYKQGSVEFCMEMTEDIETR